MEELPVYILDKILEYNSPKDIIKCKKINNYFNNNLQTIFENQNSFVQKRYLKNYKIDNCRNWLSMINYSNKKIIEDNIETYSIILKNTLFDKYSFHQFFSQLREVYDGSLNQYKDLGILFFILFKKNIHLFKVKHSSLTTMEIYRQEIYFYYLIDIYLYKKNKEYLKYLIDIFEDLFTYISKLDDQDKCVIHKIIYTYIHSSYIRGNNFFNLYQVILDLLIKYKIDIIDDENDYYTEYLMMYSDY